MIVKVTELVISYKQWARRRLVTKVIEIKKQMAKKYKKIKSSTRAGQLSQGMLKKSGESINMSKRRSIQSGQSIASSKKSQRISRYSNVNIAMLNSMKSTETNMGEELDLNLTKQTKIEQKVTLLTIKRTMT